jgi:methionine synthase II (cobalamin-independent)
MGRGAGRRFRFLPGRAVPRFVPKGAGVVLGFVTSKTQQLENPDDLKRRGEATKFIDLDRLAAGPQCGFASTVAGNPVTESDEQAKFKLCVDVAREKRVCPSYSPAQNLGKWL